MSLLLGAWLVSLLLVGSVAIAHGLYLRGQIHSLDLETANLYAARAALCVRVAELEQRGCDVGRLNEIIDAQKQQLAHLEALFETDPAGAGRRLRELLDPSGGAGGPPGAT